MDSRGTDVSFLIEEQISLVNGILDRIIPPQGEMPGAGEVNLAPYIDRFVSNSQDLRALFGRGLKSVERCASERFKRGFTELSDDERTAVLETVETAEPEFFDVLVRQTYNGYYTHPQVTSRLGRDSRPPQPQGYPLEAGNFSNLEKVRRRGPIYRKL